MYVDVEGRTVYYEEHGVLDGSLVGGDVATEMATNTVSWSVRATPRGLAAKPSCPRRRASLADSFGPLRVGASTITPCFGV